MLHDLLGGTTAPPASERIYARGRFGACFVCSFFIFPSMDAPSLVGAGANWLPRADDFTCIKLARPMQSGSARNVCASCGRLPLDVLLRAAFSCWGPFGDHPLKLERYRED